ncbi:TonB-dependent receptor [Sapientia aquatica]|uniref:TonB-dependent receptor n=2 Tax=Sapientia aquatica TaxID=1549640 RepID=A0A4R5W2V1_9BURK|nr:TonB-dependent receptor [Sapientia aquatica]
MLSLQSGAFAQTTPPNDGNTNTVIVTGTRQTGVKAVDSSSPIQLIDGSVLEATGQSDLIGALSQVFPSFVAQATGGDTANLTLSARLRGISPNDTLVLVNGKRRHTTANLSVDGSAFQGGAAADLNFIPIASIDHVEVLTDGAAAQYGTDAIAGVINIILKKDASGGSISTSGGRYVDGGGNTATASINGGFELGENGFINLTADFKSHDHSVRSGPDPRALNLATAAKNPTFLTSPDFPYLDRIFGDAAYHQNVASANSGYKIDAETNLYAFATLGKKTADTYENYRLPSKIPAVYPNGFNPKETIDETDFALTVGAKGKLFHDWTWDVSSTYGKDLEHIGVENSANIALFNATGATPTTFHAGNFVASQWTQNIDLGREINIGWATPLNFATGLEFRTDKYEIDAGDAASSFQAGSSSYPGFQSTDAGTHSRTNSAAYIDLAGSPVKELKVDAAARFEKYSDFGNTSVGKLSLRYDFTPVVALRGTISSGFRAPTLAEEYYSATNVSPTSAFVQLPPNSAGARIVGIDGLKPEKSNNYSFGLVVQPTRTSTLTADFYKIDIRDRIVGSGSLYGSGSSVNSPAVTQAIAANGNVLDPSVTYTGINIFTNGVDTSTKGLDLLFTTAYNYGDYGHVDWSASAAYNKTELTKIHSTPAQLQPQLLLDQSAVGDLTTESPKVVVNLGALWKVGSWAVNLRENIYGPASGWGSEDGTTFYQTTIHTKAITNLEIANHLTKSLTVSVGATNLFNQYPTRINGDLTAAANKANDASVAVRIYPQYSPFGINGGYYYVRGNYSF